MSGEFFKRKNFFRSAGIFFVFFSGLFLSLAQAEDLSPLITEDPVEIFSTETTEEELLQEETGEETEEEEEEKFFLEGDKEEKFTEEDFSQESDDFSEKTEDEPVPTFSGADFFSSEKMTGESEPMVETEEEISDEEEELVEEEPEEEEKKTGPLFFNEVAWMGSENSSYDEWLELYNPNDFAIDLAGWKLSFWKPLKNSAGEEMAFEEKIYGQSYFSIVFKEEAEISEKGFFLAAKEKYNQKIKERVDFFYQGTLVNEGGYLELKNEKGEVVDSVEALNGWPEGDNSQKKTMERNAEGTLWQTSSIIGGTPKEKNSQPEETPEEEDNFCVDYPAGVVLSEILPNPAGSDTGNEWVEVANKNDFEVNLNNWWLANSGGKKFFLSEAVLPAESFLKINLPTSFVLKNQKERLELFSCQQMKKDEVAWTAAAPSGQSLNRTEAGLWRWSRHLTPERANIFNSYPLARVKKIKESFLGQPILFDASGSVDADGDKLKFVWDFGDGRKSYLAKVSHTFTKTGKKEIVLRLNDGSEEVEKIIKLEVRKYPSRKIIFTKILPNPAGNDFSQELIWLKNNEKKRINLRGWKILSGSSEEKATAHLIREDFFLSGGREKELTQKECAFSLTNKAGYLALVYPDGEKAMELTYSSDGWDLPEGAEYFLAEDGKWQWQEVPNMVEEKTVSSAEEEGESPLVLGATGDFSWEELFAKLGKEKTLSWEEMEFLGWQKRNEAWLQICPLEF